MTAVKASRPDRWVSLDELFDQAHRLWAYADEIYSATKYPFVSRQVLKTAPTFGDILEHVIEAARTQADLEMEEKYGPELRRLEEERARLVAEVRALGGEPPSFDTFDSQQASPPSPVEVMPASQTSSVLGPDEFPWVNDWAESIHAQASIDSLSYAVLGHAVREPPLYWPEVIRRPVIYFTRLRLVSDADLVIRGEIPAPRGESTEAYAARFTRRVLRLDGDLWGSVAMAIAEGRWQNANNPIAYVSRVAQREYRRAEGWLDPSRSNDVYAHEIPSSLDRPPTVTGDPLGALIVERSNLFADAEFMLDFDLAVRRSALSTGAQLALHARLEGISRRLAPEVLGLPASEIEAGWKALQRTLPRLREHLSA